mgnify:CR=1 FL=1
MQGYIFIRKNTMVRGEGMGVLGLKIKGQGKNEKGERNTEENYVKKRGKRP